MRKIVKIVFIVLNLLAVVLLIGSTLAGSVSPSRVKVFSFLSYGYLYLLVLNVVFIIFWLCFSSKWFLLSLAAILVRANFLPLYFQIGGTDSVDPATGLADGTLRVMTANVYHFRATEGVPGACDRNMLDFLEIVAEEAPDVIAMQEYIGRGDTVALSDSLTRMGYVHQASGYENGSMTGEVIFSKLPVLRTVRIEGPSKLFANLDWGGDTLRLYCLHLTSYGLDESDQKNIADMQIGSVDSLRGNGTVRKFNKAIGAHEREWNILEPYFESQDALTVVAGDFNETPASFFYQKCRKYFKDSYCEEGQGFSTTYHGVFANTKALTFPSFRIDMVLHSRDMEAVAYKRVKSSFSDHYPIVVTLKASTKTATNGEQ